ncbi:MAG: hypothetical protein AAF439_03245 [Pseudomonadota bacterium]
MIRRLSPVTMLRLATLAGLLALTIAVSFLLPRITAPPERFGTAMQLIRDGRGDEAVHLLEDYGWRGVAQYRAGRYRRALYEWYEDETVANLYNTGNAYARLHTWDGARSAYLRALRLDPGHENAAYNLALIERAEKAEQELEDAERDTQKLGVQKDDNRKDEDDDPGEDDSTVVEENGADRGAQRGDAERTDQGGQSDIGGTLGDRALSDDAQAGPSGGEPLDGEPETSQTGAASAMIRRESAQAAEILLRQIRDDPALVLGARLRTSDRLRHPEAYK